MSYYQAQQPLPLPYDRPIVQPQNYPLDRPPAVPQGIQCLPQLQAYIPMVSSCIANESAAKMGLHAGRMFLFNVLANNNFSNNEFASAVASAMDILGLNLYKGIYQAPEQGLQEAVTLTLSLMCSANFELFPALKSVTPPQVVNDAGKNLMMLSNMNNEISQFKNAMMQRGNVQPQTQSYQPQGFNTQPAFNPNAGMQINPAFGNRSAPNNFGGAVGSNMNSGMFNNGGNTGGVQVPMTKQTEGKYSHITRNANAPKVPNQADYFQKPVPMPEVVSMHVKDLKWIPSIVQPYKLAYDPATHILALKEVSTSEGDAVISYLIEKEDKVDRSKHSLVDTGITKRIPEGFTTREAAITSSVEALGELMVDPDAEVADGADAFIKTKLVIDTFLETAIFNLKLDHKMHSFENDCGIFRSYNLIGAPIISMEDYTDLITEIMDASSLKVLATHLTNYMREGISKGEDSKVELIYHMDKLLTKEMNLFIKHKLSIEGVSIDSFMSDSGDLASYLGTKFSSVYKQAFIDHQYKFIANTIVGYDAEMKDFFNSELLNESENNLVNINYLPQYYCLTFVNVHNTELNITVNTDNASMLTQSNTPLMYKLAADVFDNKGVESDICSKDVMHYLVITKDGIIYELHKGVIGVDCYLISAYIK